MKPTAILCADLHFRDSQPVSRTDDFFHTQVKKMKWLNNLQKEHDCHVLCSGDYFDHWKPSPKLLSACIANMPHVMSIPGNHDLPNHNLNLLGKSGLYTLFQAGTVDILRTELGEHYGFIKKIDTPTLVPHIAIIHKLINHQQTDASAQNLMEELNEYELILTGDNHQTFTDRRPGQLLVNPGSFTRQTIDQINSKPCVFLWYQESNTVERINVPIEENVFSYDHFSKGDDDDERLKAFVDGLDDTYEIGLSFKKNLEEYFNVNSEPEPIMDMVWTSFEGENDG